MQPPSFKTNQYSYRQTRGISGDIRREFTYLRRDVFNLDARLGLTTFSCYNMLFIFCEFRPDWLNISPDLSGELFEVNGDWPRLLYAHTLPNGTLGITLA